MKCLTRVAIPLVLICISFLCLAQQQSSKPSDPPNSPAQSSEGLHVDLTPYLWFAGVHGSAGVLGHDASIHASVGDVLDYLNLGFMGSAEVRYNRILVPVDFIWIKLTDKKALPFDQGDTAWRRKSL